MEEAGIFEDPTPLSGDVLPAPTARSRVRRPRSGSSYWLAGFFWAVIPVSFAYLLALANPMLRAELQRGLDSPLSWTLAVSFILLTLLFAVLTAARDLRGKSHA